MCVSGAGCRGLKNPTASTDMARFVTARNLLRDATTSWPRPRVWLDTSRVSLDTSQVAATAGENGFQ